MDFGDQQDTNNPFEEEDMASTSIDSYFWLHHHHQQEQREEEQQLEEGSMHHHIEIISTETINNIVYYIIRLHNGKTLKRRYSDFQSLRINLVKFFPTKMIPIIPEKHSLKDYLGGNSVHRNTLIIDYRRRRFNQFLNTLYNDSDISQSIIFTKFIDPDEEIWLEVLRYAPFTLLPSNVLLSSPRDPLKPNPYYSYLPIPPMLLLRHFDSPLQQQVFKPLELRFLHYKQQLLMFERQCKLMVGNLKNLTMRKVELGANFNVFSLLDNNILVEQIGQAVDFEFINLEVFIKNFIILVKEPIQDLKNQCTVALNLLQFRKYKELQLQSLKSTILKKHTRANKLISTENLHLKLDIALQKGSQDSPTIAQLVKRLQLENSQHNKPTPRQRGIFKLFSNGNKKSKQVSQSYIETRDIQSMSSQERLNELTYLLQELSKLGNCFELLLQDEIYLDCQVEKNCHLQIDELQLQLFNVGKNFEKIVLIYCKELNHWPGADPIPLHNN